MTTERQKILDRIKKLLALGDSNFDEEARTSLHQAHKMMKQHSVSYTELAGLEQTVRDPTDDEIVGHAAVLLHAHMATIGRKGGLIGGQARNRKLSARRRKEIAKAAGIASGEARRKNRGY
jgi:uncharacterized lipoprotein YehR (DUF1307 family)